MQGLLKRKVAKYDADKETSDCEEQRIANIRIPLCPAIDVIKGEPYLLKFHSCLFNQFSFGLNSPNITLN